MDTLGGPIPDEAKAAWAKSSWEYREDDMDDFIWHFFVLYSSMSLASHEQYVCGVKYWLPRLLHGLSEGESTRVTDDWFISEQLVRAKWLAWPAEEVEAVRQWCTAWLLACISVSGEANNGRDLFPRWSGNASSLP